MSERVTLEILRYRPEVDAEPHFQTYTIPYEEDWVVLDALNHIKDHVDATLSYRWSCHMAICGSCGMMINGEPKLACHAFLRDYRHDVIRIEPLDHFPIERDLVTVMDSFIVKLSSVNPGFAVSDVLLVSWEAVQRLEPDEERTALLQVIDRLRALPARPQ